AGPAPGAPGWEGRPKLAATAPATAWNKTTIDIRGWKAGRLVAVFDLLWYQVRKDALVRLVIVRDPAGTEPDDFFVTTDLTPPPAPPGDKARPFPSPPPPTRPPPPSPQPAGPSPAHQRKESSLPEPSTP